MSTTQELLAANERYETLRAAIEKLAAEWYEAEDEADAYGPRSAFDGRDCAEMLRDLLDGAA